MGCTSVRAVSERDSDFTDSRAQALARLATLQRLKDEMRRNNRQAMMDSIERLMAAETRFLRELREPGRDNERDKDA
jgi:hypothetical protein